MNTTSSSSISEDDIQFVVTAIQGQPSNRFVVTRPDKPEEVPDLAPDDTVTFSLKVWRGEGEPRKGQVVRLHEVVLFDAGWRAQAAFPIRLTSRHCAMQKEEE